MEPLKATQRKLECRKKNCGAEQDAFSGIRHNAYCQRSGVELSPATWTVVSVEPELNGHQNDPESGYCSENMESECWTTNVGIQAFLCGAFEQLAEDEKNDLIISFQIKRLSFCDMSVAVRYRIWAKSY